MKNKDFRLVFIFIFILFFFKIIYLYFLPISLSYDEAYYWDWSRFFDFGYYNKPPMIAWIIKISTVILGNTEFAIRFPALICLTLTIFTSYILVFKHFDKKNAKLLLAFLSFTPILTVYSFIMTIDPPLLLFWILSLYFFLEYFKNPSLKNAILTGIFMGFGLLTKQTMFIFIFLSLVYLLIFYRNLFFKKETFLIFLIALIIYSPNLYWNYIHQFVLLKHTEEHFSRKTVSIYSFLKFLIDSIAVYTPLFLVFLYIGFFYIKNFFKKTSSENLNFLYFLSFPAILIFTFLSFFIKLNVNWILPFILTGYLFLFGYFYISKGWKVLIYTNLIIAIIFSCVIYVFGYFSEKFPEPFQVLLEKFRGWEILAERVEKYYNKGEPILTEDRATAATLSFYLKAHPEIYVIQFKNFPENQYHIWRNTNSLIGAKVLVVKRGFSEPQYLKDSKKLEEIRIRITKKRYRNFSIWQGVLNFKR